MGDVVKFQITDTNSFSEKCDIGEPFCPAESNQSLFSLSGHRIDAYTKLPKILKKKGDSKEGDSMDWQEKYIDELNQNIRDVSTANKEFRSELKSVQSNIEKSFDSKLNQFMAELRDRDNQRHAEILAMQDRSDKSVQQLTTEISSVKSEMHATQKWFRGLVVAAGLSFLAIAVSLSIGMMTVVNTVEGLAKAAIPH